jgi:membrane fusion protein, multidrug efflux system
MENRTPRNSAKRVWLGGGLILIIAVVGFLSMFLKQKNAISKETAEATAEVKKGPIVKAIKAGMTNDDNGIVVIGEARPFQSVTLYAKTSGYMNKILVDKGDVVKQGQLLATIVSPETDQAYIAALADLENKKKILARDEALVKKEYISKEDAETSATAVKMAEAQVESYREQMQYKDIIAPFSGTVTARYADPGALVQNATSSQTSAQPVVTVSQLDEIRIYIYVAQNDAEYMKDGYPATITIADKPDLKIPATITRISGELDPQTRMMLVELDLPNKDGVIIPGSYVQVHLNAPATNDLSVPSEAVVIRGKSSFIPVIGADSAVHYQEVTIGNNDGVHATVLNGVQKGELIGLNVSPSITEGQKVRLQM